MDFLQYIFSIVLLYSTPYKGDTAIKDAYFEEDTSMRDMDFSDPLFNLTCSSLPKCLAKCIFTYTCTAVCHRGTDGSCSGHVTPVATTSSPGKQLWKAKGSSPEPCIDGKFYENKEDPSKYYRCASGALKDKECPNGLIFDVAISICRWP